MVYITDVHLDGGNRHEHISAVRWRNPEDGKTGSNTRSEMIEWIDSKHGTAKVTDGKTTVTVAVVKAAYPYLRTHADGTWTDNLLALPRY